jgi:hypothetical protein
MQSGCVCEADGSLKCMCRRRSPPVPYCHEDGVPFSGTRHDSTWLESLGVDASCSGRYPPKLGVVGLPCRGCTCQEMWHRHSEQCWCQVC